ncbi:virulence RhuM family protein [Hyalangium gracile]|uniref:virulence RhuM family protein n=1 Tax=Hyalangium gracile TaxID=394092 RepID=UPI001CCF5399|nr:virulence RhuM family protein [Hyalangium gracile]
MKDDNAPLPREAEFLLYQTEDGRTRVEVRFEGETLWLTQAALAALFQTTPQNITQHIAAIYAERELEEDATCKPFLQVREEGMRRVQRSLKHYNLPMILAVGYRVRSHRGTQFRQWATARLDEYLRKGFTLDDSRLKNPPGPGVPDYFNELLARIRDIRSSEKVFWKKVLEIYSTSIDYDPHTESSQLFFATVQNKMHWAAHGHTAAEIIIARADAAKPNMGLTSWAGDVPRRADVAVAKNYLITEELEALNRIVNAYLEFAELQALSRKPMYMSDWISKLDDFLRLSEREVLQNAGSISRETAVAKAEHEYARFSAQRANKPSPVEAHFANAITEVRQLEKQRTSRPKGRKKP